MMVQLDVWLEIQYKTSRFAGFHTIRTRNKWNDAHYDRSKNDTIIDREETNELNRYFQSLDQICETKEIELRHIITVRLLVFITQDAPYSHKVIAILTDSLSFYSRFHFLL